MMPAWLCPHSCKLSLRLNHCMTKWLAPLTPCSPAPPQVQLARAQGSLEAASSERDGLRQLISKAEEKMSQLVRQLEAEVAARRDVEQQCDLHSLEAAAASSRAESLQQHAEQLEGIIQDLREQEVHAGKHITQQEDSIVQLQEQLGGLMAVMGSFAEDLERLVPTQWRYLIEGPPRNALQMQDAAGWGRRLNGVLEMIRLAGQQLQEMTSQVGRGEVVLHCMTWCCMMLVSCLNGVL